MMRSENLIKIVRFEGGFDCIKFYCKFNSKSCYPGEGGSHGKHGVAIRFVLQGNDGAVQFLLYTGWLPQYKKPSSIGYINIADWGFSPTPADLGCHSRTARYPGQEPFTNSCEYCDGKPCYYDGSSLNANDAMYALVNGGDEALWSFLEGYYNHAFHDGPYPSPAEYPMATRNQREDGEPEFRREGK